MRRVTATREVVNSARRKCSDSISDMVLFSFFDVLFLMIVLMIVCFDVFDVFDDRFDVLMIVLMIGRARGSRSAKWESP